MEQYISKSALVAKIERLKRNQRLDDRHGQGVLDGLHAIERFIDTLEVKEVDFHKKLLSFYRHTNDSGSLIALAKHFFELGIKAAQKG